MYVESPNFDALAHMDLEQSMDLEPSDSRHSVVGRQRRQHLKTFASGVPSTMDIKAFGAEYHGLGKAQKAQSTMPTKEAQRIFDHQVANVSGPDQSEMWKGNGDTTACLRGLASMRVGADKNTLSSLSTADTKRFAKDRVSSAASSALCGLHQVANTATPANQATPATFPVGMCRKGLVTQSVEGNNIYVDPVGDAARIKQQEDEIQRLQQEVEVAKQRQLAADATLLEHLKREASAADKARSPKRAKVGLQSGQRCDLQIKSSERAHIMEIIRATGTSWVDFCTSVGCKSLGALPVSSLRSCKKGIASGFHGSLAQGLTKHPLFTSRTHWSDANGFPTNSTISRIFGDVIKEQKQIDKLASVQSTAVKVAAEAATRAATTAIAATTATTAIHVNLPGGVVITAASSARATAGAAAAASAYATGLSGDEALALDGPPEQESAPPNGHWQGGGLVVITFQDQEQTRARELSAIVEPILVEELKLQGVCGNGA